jgi:hypothetical protein
MKPVRAGMTRGQELPLAKFVARDQNNAMSRISLYYFWFYFTRLGSGTGGCA